jgi:hypothetical protein
MSIKTWLTWPSRRKPTPNSMESAPSTPKTASEIAADYFANLHSECDKVSAQSLAEPNLARVAASHAFSTELKVWCEVLECRREVELLNVASLEYEFGLLA